MIEKPLAWLQSNRIFVWSMVSFLCWLAIAISLLLQQPAPTEALVLAPDIPLTGHVAYSSHITYTTYYVYLPFIRHDPQFNPQDRQESLTFYLQQYLSSEGVPVNWTGDHDTCNAGNTGQDFRDAVLRRINYFRVMAGMPAVTFKDEYDRKAQKAALMMSVNHDLSHSPTPDWFCYSSDGAQAAGSSNLCLGAMGWDAISVYVLEGGVVGHRRWILYPQTKEMGTGDIPNTQNHPAANALWVFDSNMWGPRPTTRNEFVAWPPPGYVPYQVVNDHWSFSYPQADFSIATVTMASGGVNVSVALEPVLNGYGENTLVWIPFGLSGGTWPRPTVDTTYTVNIQNAIISGWNRDFTYDVVIFDPTP
jgi:hypothetical protein